MCVALWRLSPIMTFVAYRVSRSIKKFYFPIKLLHFFRLQLRLRLYIFSFIESKNSRKFYLNDQTDNYTTVI